MKHVCLILLLVICFLSPANAEPLIAEYYETVYWGEEKSRERNGVEYIGREWKTHRIFPEKDYAFVLEEANNNDSETVSLIWTSRDHDTDSMGYVIGVCFAGSQNTHAVCGNLLFSKGEDVKTFLNEFKGDGENVWELIEQVYKTLPAAYLAELTSQIVESAAREVGK